MNRIETEDLIENAVYQVVARNYNVAVWNGEVFRGPSKVYGEWTLVDEYPMSEPYPKGTAYAEQRLGDRFLIFPPYGMNVVTILQIMNELVEEYRNE